MPTIKEIKSFILYMMLLIGVVVIMFSASKEDLSQRDCLKKIGTSYCEYKEMSFDGLGNTYIFNKNSFVCLDQDNRAKHVFYFSKHEQKVCGLNFINEDS